MDILLIHWIEVEVPERVCKHIVSSYNAKDTTGDFFAEDDAVVLVFEFKFQLLQHDFSNECRAISHVSNYQHAIGDTGGQIDLNSKRVRLA